MPNEEHPHSPLREFLGEAERLVSPRLRLLAGCPMSVAQPHGLECRVRTVMTIPASFEIKVPNAPRALAVTWGGVGRPACVGDGKLLLDEPNHAADTGGKDRG